MREMLLQAMGGARDTVRYQMVAMNNLANVATDGFRREIAHFDRAAGGVHRSRPDFEPGPVRMTGRTMDVAIDGPGWFKVNRIFIIFFPN